jgi:hypothetical protein
MKHARKDYDRIQDPAGLIEEDEPVFLLRAKDVNAPLAVMAWVKEGLRSGVDGVTLRLATDQAARMLQWAKTHGRKVPDVPANTCPNCGRAFLEGEELRLHIAEPCEW